MTNPLASKNDNLPALTVTDLTIILKRSGQHLVDAVSFSINAGEIFALVGESGSGKSITALAAMRLLPSALAVIGGRVDVKQHNVFTLTEQQMQSVRGYKVAMIFQDALTSLNPVQTVGQQLAETLSAHTQLTDRQMTEHIISLFSEVGLPDPQQRLGFYPHQLSGGQQQRIMIAMALACEPDVLIADEPTTALDVTIQKQILELVVKLARDRSLAVMLITHDMGVVKNTADTVAVMHQGKIIETRAVENFFSSPNHKYSQQLINSLPDISAYRMAVPVAENLLEVNHLKIYFPIKKGVFQRVAHYTRAVDDVSFHIKPGETLALVGESGSGKSTCGRAILNLESLTEGEITFAGQRIDQLNRRSMLPIRQKIQVIFQDPYSSMNPRMTVGEIIEEGMISLSVEANPSARLERIIGLLERVQLNPQCFTRYPHEFSGGQRQRIAIARALAVNPQLIICDEPTSALDVSIRAQVLDLLLDLQQEFNVSYLFITHDLSIVPHLAHRLMVMQNGKVVEHGATQQVLTAAQHVYTKTLLRSVPRLV